MMESISSFLSNLLAGGTHDGSLSLLQALSAIAIAYFGGILSSLTPCVYPMIPITVSVVGGVGHTKRAWHEVWIRGAAYVGGMALVYSFLGVLAGLTGKVFGTITNTSSWYVGLGVIMTFAALMMMDVIPFDPIVWWEGFKRKFHKGGHKPTTFHSGKTEMTVLGSFALGASSGFIAAPCTTPVLTAILAYIAKTQSIALGLSLMLAFSLGLGTLLMLIAVFAGAIQILPRSGNWMKKVKVGSGMVLLIFAEYLIFRAGNVGGP